MPLVFSSSDLTQLMMKLREAEGRPVLSVQIEMQREKRKKKRMRKTWETMSKV